jgi:hypothetical protein
VLTGLLASAACCHLAVLEIHTNTVRSFAKQWSTRIIRISYLDRAVFMAEIPQNVSLKNPAGTWQCEATFLDIVWKLRTTGSELHKNKSRKWSVVTWEELDIGIRTETWQELLHLLGALSGYTLVQCYRIHGLAEPFVHGLLSPDREARTRYSGWFQDSESYGFLTHNLCFILMRCVSLEVSYKVKLSL